MEELTRPREEIEKRLSRINNYEEVRRSPYWDEWINTVFSWGMLGFDNIDVYDLVKGKKCRLVKVEANSLKGLKQQLMYGIDPSCHGIVIGAMLPEANLEITHELLEIIMQSVNKDCEVLMQAQNESNNYILIMLTV